MAVYTVHQARRTGDPAADADRIVFVRDGFHVWAFLLAPLWMLARRLWLALLGYLVLTGALLGALVAAGASRSAVFLCVFLLHLLVGLEAATLRRWTLARRGWQSVGVVVGDDRDSAERRFFTARMQVPERRATPHAPPVAETGSEPTVRPSAFPARGSGSGDDVIGLFPQPGVSR